MSSVQPPYNLAVRENRNYIECNSRGVISKREFGGPGHRPSDTRGILAFSLAPEGQSRQGAGRLLFGQLARREAVETGKEIVA